MALPAANDTLIVATRNAGKTREFAALLEPLGIAVRSLHDYPDVPEIVEDGDTFAANALIKARTVSELFGTPALADDSGLCVDKLDGRPGVYSARFAGIGAKDADNNAKLLDELNRIAETDARFVRTAVVGGREVRLLSSARFVCALALCIPDEEPLLVEGRCEGFVCDTPVGEGGFGYDPLFYVPAYGATFAELTMEAKNAVSHRAQALVKLKEALLKRSGSRLG